MKTIYRFFLALLSCLVVSCASQDDLKKLQDQVDQLKSGSIASLESQVSALSASLSKCESVNSELSGYISTLAKQAESLSATEKSLSEQISQIEESVIGSISEAQSGALASMEAYRVTIQQQLESIESSLESLKTDQSALETKIASLRTYIEDELKKSKDWASSTFATLEQYNQISSTISSVEANVSSVQSSVEALRKQFSSAKQDVLSKIGTLQDQFASDVNGILSAYDSALSKMKEELAAAYTESLGKSLEALDESMKTWVNSQLTAYSTIAETESHLHTISWLLTATLQSQIRFLEDYKIFEDNDLAIIEFQSRLESNSADLQDLAAEIDALKQTVRSDYEAVIKAAIEEGNGEIGAKLQEALMATNKLVDDQLDIVKQEMQGVETNLKELEDKVNVLVNQAEALMHKFEHILSRVQSIVPVPSNANGQVAVANGQTEIYFEVSPRSASEALAQLGTKVFSFDAIDAKTKSITFTNIPVLSVKDNGLFLVLTVNGSVLSSSFFSGDTMMNARLKIDDGNSCVTSAYFPLCRAN